MRVKVNSMQSLRKQFKKELSEIHKQAANDFLQDTQDEIEGQLNLTIKRVSADAFLGGNYPDGSAKSNPGFQNARVKMVKKVSKNSDGSYSVKVYAFVADQSGSLHASWHIVTAGRPTIHPVNARVLRWFERVPVNVTKVGNLVVANFSSYGSVVYRPSAKGFAGRKWYNAVKNNLRQKFNLDNSDWEIAVQARDK